MVVCSDHCSLEILPKSNNPSENDRVTRRSFPLSHYDATVKYIKGEHNIVEDGLSHLVNYSHVNVQPELDLVANHHAVAENYA